jgi:hypothetical protein
LITTKGSNNSGLIGKNDLVVWGWREETLQKGDSGVEHDGALNTSLDSNFDLGVVDKVAADTVNIRGRPAVEVRLTDHAAKRVGFDLFRVRFLNIMGVNDLTSPRAVVSVFEPE